MRGGGVLLPGAFPVTRGRRLKPAVRTWAGAVSLLLAALGSAAEEPIDGWLPEETLFCLSFESPERTAARLSEGQYAGLRGHPSAQRIAIEAKGLLVAAREASLARGEVWLGPFWDVVKGPILLAVVRAGGRESPLVVMDTGEPGAFGRHLARLADLGVLGQEVERDGIRARPGSEGAGSVFWIDREGLVAFSWREDVIASVVEHLGRGGRGLAPRLDAARKKLRTDADALLYLPREAVREFVDRSTDVASLGLPEDATLALAITLDPDALDVRAFLFAPRPRRGVLALLDEPNGPLDAPPFLQQSPFVAARFDLARFVASDAGRLAKSFVQALGNRFALAQVEGEQVFLAEVDREAWMRRLLSAFPGQGGVHEAPDGAVAMRDGWLIAASRAAPVMRLLSEPAEEPAVDPALPRERIVFWRLPPSPPRSWDDPMRLLKGQAGALVNDPDGLLLVHRAALR